RAEAHSDMGNGRVVSRFLGSRPSVSVPIGKRNRRKLVREEQRRRAQAAGAGLRVSNRARRANGLVRTRGELGWRSDDKLPRALRGEAGRLHALRSDQVI